MRRWYGQFLGFIAGWLLLRHPVGGLLGLLVGYAFDHDAFSSSRKPAPKREAVAPAPSISSPSRPVYDDASVNAAAAVPEYDPFAPQG